MKITKLKNKRRKENEVSTLRCSYKLHPQIFCVLVIVFEDPSFLQALSMEGHQKHLPRENG